MKFFFENLFCLTQTQNTFTDQRHVKLQVFFNYFTQWRGRTSRRLKRTNEPPVFL